MSGTTRRAFRSPKLRPTKSRPEVREDVEQKRPIRAKSGGNTNGLVMKNSSERKAWENMSLVGALPPLATTVTSVRQSHELQSVKGVEVSQSAGNQTSSNWLEKHSVESESLSLDDLMKEGVLIRPPVGCPDHTVHLKFELNTINQFQFKLSRIVEMCQKRINWLMEGSRKIFGLLKGQRVALLVDTSDANCSYGRLQLLQQSLQALINEQLVNKDKLYLMSFGTTSEPLWDAMRDVNCRIINEARDWVNSLRPRGGCNLLSSLRQLIKWNNFDSVVLVLGSNPDQDPGMICAYVKESLAGRQLPFHTVAYDCIIPVNKMLLEDLAALTGGRYHCYCSSSNEKILTGTDLHLLIKEIQKARETLERIQEMRSGKLGDKIITIAHNEVPQVPLDIVPVSDGTIVQWGSSFGHTPLTVEHPSFPARTSTEWLKQHGLKAKGLNLYQVLAPNTYSYVKGYVSTINKNVKSKIYEESMAQFPWHDGTVKNVHVDPTVLFGYQEQLESAVNHYMRRLDWLSSECRAMFGTLVEQRVIIIIDMSVSMGPCWSRLKQDLKVLFEQQMTNKSSYNLICFGGSTQMFRPAMVEPSPDYLEASWRWILSKKCSGSRTFLEAFKLAVENKEDISNNAEVEGIYVITSGMPDHPKDLICSFVKESVAGKDISLHCIFYEDETDSNFYLPGRYATVPETANCLREIAHAGRGRFHWYRNNVGIIESDDIKIIHGELNKAYKYSQNTAMLLDSVKRRRNFETTVDVVEDEKQLVPHPPQQKARIPLLPPRQTAMSQARLNVMRSRPSTGSEPSSKYSNRDKGKQRAKTASTTAQSSGDVTVKTLCWKPNNKNSSGNLIPDITRPQFTKDREKPEPPRQVFYTEIGNNVGAIFRDYSTVIEEKKRVRRPTKNISIPDTDENVSTREWMKKYSLSKLKLDLNHIVGGTECSHSKTKVSSLHKTVPARYCDIFPTVKVKGVVKHLHLTSRELEDYEDEIEKVMKRYVKRLQWLMSGSRRVFGTMVEKKVVILIDTSGSMVTSIAELQAELSGIIWEQFKQLNIMFNLIQFSDEPSLWRPCVVPPSEENCESAVEWIKTLEAHGSTCTLDALRVAFEDPDVQGIYLLTDGKPNNSTTMVLRELAKLNNTRSVRVHTISFNCDDSSANKFLQLLAAQTGGRYHRCQPESIGHHMAHKLLTEKVREDEPLAMPVFEGDDLRRLVSEIASCRKFLLQARSYRTLLHENSQKPGDKKQSKHFNQTGASNLTRISLRNRRMEGVVTS